MLVQFFNSKEFLIVLVIILIIMVTNLLTALFSDCNYLLSPNCSFSAKLTIPIVDWLAFDKQTISKLTWFGKIIIAPILLMIQLFAYICHVVTLIVCTCIVVVLRFLFIKRRRNEA